MMMTNTTPDTRVYTVGELARLLGVPPWRISNLLYQQRVRPDLSYVVAGRRIVPHAMLPDIRAALGVVDQGGAAGSLPAGGTP